MQLVNSVAVGDVGILGVSLSTSNTSIAIKLQDHSLHLFNPNGERIRTRAAPSSLPRSLERETYKVTNDALMVIDNAAQRLIVEGLHGSLTTSINLPWPASVALFAERDNGRYIIVAANLAKLAYIPFPHDLNDSEEQILTRTTDIPAHQIFLYHVAHGLLALLCVDGVVQIWRLPTASEELQNLGSIASRISLQSGLADNVDSPLRKAQEDVRMFSVLVLSRRHVLTGHRNGTIRLWCIDASGMKSTPTTFNHEPIHSVEASPGRVINKLLAVGGSSPAEVLSTDGQGFIKLWRVSHSDETATLQLVSQYELFDHAITCSVITSDGRWIVAGGKNGGGAENRCGLDARVRAVRLSSLAAKGGELEVIEIGTAKNAVWNIAEIVVESGQRRVAISCMNRGRAWLEVWNVD